MSTRSTCTAFQVGSNTRLRNRRTTTRRTSSLDRKWSTRKIVGSGSWTRRISLRCRADARSVPKGFSMATASEPRSLVEASAGSTDVEQARGQREVDQRVRTIVAEHPADVLRPGDVGGLEAEHLHDGVAGGRRHGRVLFQPGGDVLAEIFGGPVGVGRAHDREPWWQELSLGQLGNCRHQQAAGEVAGGSEQDHSPDHGMSPFLGRGGSRSRSGTGAGDGGTPAHPGQGAQSPRGGNGRSHRQAAGRSDGRVRTQSGKSSG